MGYAFQFFLYKCSRPGLRKREKKDLAIRTALLVHQAIPAVQRSGYTANVRFCYSTKRTIRSLQRILL